MPAASVVVLGLSENDINKGFRLLTAAWLGTGRWEATRLTGRDESTRLLDWMGQNSMGERVWKPMGNMVGKVAVDNVEYAWLGVA